MSTQLRDCQWQMQQHVLGRADASALIAGDAPHVEQRLHIYVNAYRARLTETLVDSYEKTCQFLGDERFTALAQRYIEASPPLQRNLRAYGEDFANLLSRALPGEPVAAELARLDWALRAAFDGPDGEPLTGASLGAIAPERWPTSRLQLHPTAQFLDFEHNSVALWQAYDDNVPPPMPQHGDVPVTWLVWRKGLQPHFRSLSRFEAVMLRALSDGECFATACEHAAEDNAQDAAQIGLCLRRWLEDELLVGIVDEG